MPAATPVTIPEDTPTVAIDVLLLVQVPPGVASVSVLVPPIDVVAVPLIAAGAGETVMSFVAVHPPAVYVMVTTPAARPDTRPVLVTDAIVGALLVQVPPAGEPVRDIVLPTQTVDGPDIDALDVTVMSFVTKLEPTV